MQCSIIVSLEDSKCMEIPRLGITNDLDPKVISKYSIVGILNVCDSTLAVHEHALQRYREKSGHDDHQNPMFDLADLQFQLQNSKVVKRKNAKKQEWKYYKEKAIYRLQQGWMYVLVWKEKLNFWLLKTVYPLEPGKMRGYKVVQTRQHVRASTWSPSFVNA